MMLRKQTVQSLKISDIGTGKMKTLPSNESVEPVFLQPDIIYIIKNVDTGDFIAFIQKHFADPGCNKPRCTGHKYMSHIDQNLFP